MGERQSQRTGAGTTTDLLDPLNTAGLRAVQRARPFHPLFLTLNSPQHVLPRSRAVLPPHTPLVIGQRLEDLLATHAGLRDGVLSEVMYTLRGVAHSHLEGWRGVAPALQGEGEVGRYQWLQVRVRVWMVSWCLLGWEEIGS